MRKRKIIAVLSMATLSFTLFTGCSTNVDNINNDNQTTTVQDTSKEDSSNKEDEVDNSSITISEVKINDEMFRVESPFIEIDNTTAHHDGFIGKYDVFSAEDYSAIYLINENETEVALKLNLDNHIFKVKTDDVLGLDDYFIKADINSGEVLYATKSNQLVIIDLNNDSPDINLINLDFEVDYISSYAVLSDTLGQKDVYVVSTDCKLYRISYIDSSNQADFKIEEIEGYDDVKFNELLEGKDSSSISILHNLEDFDSYSLVVNKLNGENEVLNIDYNDDYSKVSLSKR